MSKHATTCKHLHILVVEMLVPKTEINTERGDYDHVKLLLFETRQGLRIRTSYADNAVFPLRRASARLLLRFPASAFPAILRPDVLAQDVRPWR